jgi:hypothetical protein
VAELVGTAGSADLECILERFGPLPYLGAAASRVASAPALRDPCDSGSLAAGYLAPLGWLVASLRSPDSGNPIGWLLSTSFRLVALRAACARWLRVRRMDLAQVLI